LAPWGLRARRAFSWGLAGRVAPKPAVAAVAEFGTVERTEIRRALTSTWRCAGRRGISVARQQVVEACWPSDRVCRTGLLRLGNALVGTPQEQDSVLAALGITETRNFFAF
jgi:hypothetical protein